MSKRKGKWITIPGGGRIRANALRSRKALLIGTTIVLLIGVLVFAGFTIVNNPADVTQTTQWYRNDLVTSGNLISDIVSATVSGTIRSQTWFYTSNGDPSWYTDANGLMCTFVGVSVQVTSTDGAGRSYSFAGVKSPLYTDGISYNIPFTNLASGIKHFVYDVSINTKQIPNGAYLFTLYIAYDKPDGTPDGKYFSLFSASFSTGSTNGENGGGSTQPSSETDYTIAAVIIVAIVAVVFAGLLTFFYLRNRGLQIPFVRRR